VCIGMSPPPLLYAVMVVGSRDRGGREGLMCYSTRGATVPTGAVHNSATAAARVVGR